MIEFSIDGKEVSGQEGWTILEVAKSHGIDIPTLCYHPSVEPLWGLPPLRGGGGRRPQIQGGGLLHLPHSARHQGPDREPPG